MASFVQVFGKRDGTLFGVMVMNNQIVSSAMQRFGDTSADAFRTACDQGNLINSRIQWFLWELVLVKCDLSAPGDYCIIAPFV